MLSALATITEKVSALDDKVSALDERNGRTELSVRRLEEGQEEIKAHLTQQDAYLRQSFERITDMLGYEERIAELERKVSSLMRQ